MMMQRSGGFIPEALSLRMGLAFVALVSTMLLVLGVLSFELMLAFEDLIIANISGRALDCHEHRSVDAFAQCMSTPGALASHLVVYEDLVVNTYTGGAIYTEALEQLDPLEPYIGLSVLTLMLLAALLTLTISQALTRLVLRPIRGLQNIVEETPPDQLAPALSTYPLPTELEGLRGRLVESLEHVVASRRREVLFSRYVSHELRSPLAVCLSAAELIALDGELTNIQARALARFERAVFEMQLTIDTLLELARTTQARGVGRNVSPAQVLNELCQTFEAEAERKGIRFVYLDETSSVAPMVNETALTIVLRNLISNAMRHTHEGVVELYSNGVELRVTDSGTGIPADKIPLMLKPFESEAPDGFGLGLSLVVDICESLGWTFGLTLGAERGLIAHVLLRDAQEGVAH